MGGPGVYRNLVAAAGSADRRIQVPLETVVVGERMDRQVAQVRESKFACDRVAQLAESAVRSLQAFALDVV